MISKENLEKVEQANIRNILKKVRNGKILSVAEKRMLEDYESEPSAGLESLTCNIKQIAELFGYTTQRIDQLYAEGIIIKKSRGKYYVWQSVKNVIAYRDTRKKNQWDKHGEDVDPEQYEAHRARLTKAKADVAEIQASIAKGNAHDAGAVEAVWTDMLMNCRSKLLGMPSKLAPKIRKETDLAVCKDLIEQAVHDALAELAAYDPTRITNEYLSTHRLDVAPAATVDGEPVG